MTIKVWESFHYCGDAFSLDHLTTFKWTFVQPSKNGKPEIQYLCIIEFGLHCFTRGLNLHKKEKWEDIDNAFIYSDQREKRIFDFNRYELSKKLPEITKELGQRNCFHTGKENFFIIEIINKEGVKQEYEVYFQVSKSQSKLRIFVQSAYVRDVEHKTSQPHKKKISFFIIANNVKNNKKIKTPPK